MIEYTARITSTDTPRVGGRNLLLNSDRTIEIKVHSTQWGFLPHSPSINLNDLNGTPVTVSFWAKSTGGNQRLYISLASGNHSKVYLTKPKSVIIPKEWTYFNFSVAEKSDAELNRVIYATGYTGGATDGMVWLKNIKLEQGTVATDWTLAPEDLDDRISTVNTSLTALASTLLDPDKGEIHKLTSQLESHKTDTDKSFAELSDHPLTIDDNGYWRIWNVKQQQYVTTQYQSRGRDGEDGAKGADGHTPEIHVGTDYYIYVDGVKQQYIRGQKGEPGHNPSPEEVLGTSRFAELLGGEVTSQIVPVAQDLATTNSNITRASNYAIDLINETQHQLCDLQVLGMSDGGVVEVKRQASCVSYDYLTPSLGTVTNPPQPPQPKYTTQQIPLTLRSSHDALSKQVSNLQVQLTSCTQQLTATKQELAQLKADTTITPVLNTDTRKRSGSTTLYPRYGDWLLTSDAEEQYISFSGLSAEVGRSIYIQTRKRVYLYANGHSFFGLPGTSSSTAVNQWLSNNTTYRFVRADATNWLVTASSSPYPWT